MFVTATVAFSPISLIQTNITTDYGTTNNIKRKLLEKVFTMGNVDSIERE